MRIKDLLSLWGPIVAFMTSFSNTTEKFEFYENKCTYMKLKLSCMLQVERATPR